MVSLFPTTSFLRFKLEQLHNPQFTQFFLQLAHWPAHPSLSFSPCSARCNFFHMSIVHWTPHCSYVWSFVVNLITELCSFTWIVASLCFAILEHHLEQEMRRRRMLRDRICLSSCSTPCLYWAQQNSCFEEKPVMESVILALTVMEIWDGNSQNISLGSAKEIRAFLHKQEKYSRFC